MEIIQHILFSSYPVAWQNDQLNAESSHILGHGPMCLEKEISEWVGTTLERGPRLKTGCPYSKCRDTQWQAFMRNYCGTRLGASFSRQLSAAQSTESPEWQWQGLNHYFTIQTPSWGWLVAVMLAPCWVPNLSTAEDNHSLIRQNTLEGSLNFDSKLEIVWIPFTARTARHILWPCLYMHS